MLYQQHMYGSSPQDPVRAHQPVHREGGVGGVALVVGTVVGALGAVIWMAGTRSTADIANPAPLVAHQGAGPAVPASPRATPASY